MCYVLDRRVKVDKVLDSGSIAVVRHHVRNSDIASQDVATGSLYASDTICPNILAGSEKP